MNFDPITSKENPLFKEIRNLQATGSKGQKARVASGQALLEGIHLVQTWVGDPALRTLLTSEIGLQNAEISQAVYEHIEICPDTKVYQLDSTLWDLLSELVSAPHIAGLLDLPKSYLTPPQSITTASLGTITAPTDSILPFLITKVALVNVVFASFTMVAFVKA